MLRPLLLFAYSLCFLALSAQEDNCSFGLVLSSVEAETGDTVTIDVTVRQFEEIIALQYQQNWNPQELSFVEILYNPALPFTPANFNLAPAQLNQGKLNFLFVETNLDGLTLQDNDVLYSLRMRVDATSATALSISSPDDFLVEIIKEGSVLVDNYYFLHAVVDPTVASTTSFPGLTSACLYGQACNNPDLGSVNIAPSGTAPFSIQWTSPEGFNANTAEITGLNSGVYQLALTDGSGNTVNGDFYVSSNAGLDLTLAVDADECGGMPDGAVTSSLSGGSGTYSYLWSNGSTAANLSDLLAGTYSLTVTDLTLGCSVSGTATVQGLSNIQGYFTIVTPSCDNSNDGVLTINVDMGSGTGPFTYLWSNGVTTATASNLNPGFYTVTVTDGAGCSAIFTNFLLATPFTVDATVTGNNCGESIGSIEVLLSEDDYSFLWSNGAITNSINDLDDGVYSVTITNNASGCTATESYTITSEEMLLAYNIECGSVDGTYFADITAVIWNNADGPYTFDWSTGETQVSDQFSAITVPDNGSYSVTVTSASGCTSTIDGIVVDCSDDNPAFFLTPATSSLFVGQNICLSVRADQFTAINGTQFTLSWDENLLTYTGVDNLLLNGLTTSNFGTGLVEDGLLTVSWLSSDLINGESLPDNSVLFDLCLQVSSTASATTNVVFTNSPTPLEVITTSNDVISATTTGAQLQLNDPTTMGDLSFLVGDANVSIGDQFCVPLKANHFTNLIGHQLTLTWDEEALQFTGVQSLNLPNLTVSSFGSLAEAQGQGRLRMLWSNTNVTGISLGNEAVLAEVCFTAIGEAGTYPIDFSTVVLPVEAVDANYENPIIQTEAGTIIIDGEAPELASLRIASAGVEPGATVCVPVEAVEFSQIVGMQFSINWDANRLIFDELVILDNLPWLQESNFNVIAENGTLSFSWIGNVAESVSLPEGTPLFELCFTAQATEGPAGVIFSGQPTAIEFIRDNMLLPFVAVNGEITISADGLVWPGDTNDDGIANNLDLLPIGLGFGSEGAVRNNPSLQWLAQYAEGWAAQTPASEVNYRHADTNGDGIVNGLDTLALSLNWGLEAENFAPGTPEDFFTGAPFFVEADTVQAGATARLPIILGVPDEQVNDAYGIAFSIRYPAEMITPGSLQINADGWLGIENDNLLLMYHDYPAQGRVEVAMVRTDGQEMSGEGTIGELIIIMEDVILRGLVDVMVPIVIEDVTLINFSEQQLPTAPKQTVTLVEGVTNTDTPAWANDISVLPNPTTGPLKIESGEVIVESIRLTDVNGKLLLSQKIDNNELDLSSYPAGVYYLQLQTPEGSLYEKVVKF
ncbi:cohesin domain-containing protein [Lewinella cohaerens]|uniref:cohesin domain-containing protein n=1 Tax=Lewinella cohaerens TaxID=70995 RepID=UPI00035DA10E|nr:cohesin domain-containing protein [Lewinella cohaerens]